MSAFRERVVFSEGVETPKACLDCSSAFRCENEGYVNCPSGRVKVDDFKIENRRISGDSLPSGFSEVPNSEMLRNSNYTI